MIINIDTLQLNNTITKSVLTKGAENIECTTIADDDGHVTKELLSALLVPTPRPAITTKTKRALMLLHLIEKTGFWSADLTYYCDLQKKSRYRIHSYRYYLSFIISLNTTKGLFQISSVTFTNNTVEEHKTIPYIQKQEQVVSKLMEDIATLNREFKQILTLY